MAKKHANTEVVIGSFYQRSADPMDVVYTVGSSRGKIHGYDAKLKSFCTTPATVLTWTQLAVNDFPNSSDPRLPYVYDLYWDVKHVSELRHLEADHKAEVEDLLVKEFGIKKPFLNLAALSRVVGQQNDIQNEYTQNSVPSTQTTISIDQPSP